MKTYQTKLKEVLPTFTATWPADTSIELGSVGRFQDGRFIVETSLTELGIPMQPASEEHHDLNYFGKNTLQALDRYVHQDTNGIYHFNVAARGKTLAIDMGNDFVFMLMKQVTHYHIANIDALTAYILKLYNEGKWQRNWLIVAETFEADQGVVILGRRGASFELSPQPTNPPWQINLQLRIDRMTSLGPKTPFFKPMGIKRSFFPD